MIIKTGTRRHLSHILDMFLIFFHIFPLSSIFLSSFTLYFFFSYFFFLSFMTSFFQSSFFAHFCFHSYSFFFIIYILLLCFFLFLLLRLSFLCAVHAVDGAARSSPAWGSSPFWRVGLPARGRGTAVSRVQGHVGSEGAGETRSFHAEGEWWAMNQDINYNSCKCVAMLLATTQRIVSLNLSFVKYVFRRRKLKLIILLNVFEITFSC